MPEVVDLKPAGLCIFENIWFRIPGARVISPEHYPESDWRNKGKQDAYSTYDRYGAPKDKIALPIPTTSI